MRPYRLVLGCLAALALAPGTLVRETPGPPVAKAPVHVVPLATERGSLGPFRVEGAWSIVSENDWHGGYSALIATGPRALLAASDTGHFLTLDISAKTPRANDAGIARDLPRGGSVAKRARDIESLTFDASSGTIWAGLEMSNRIERYDRELAYSAGVAPAAMRRWGANSGPEAFVRLADGRFFAIEERASGWRSDRHRAVIFAGDPVAGARQQRLQFVAPRGYRPVDLAPLEGGRAVVLYRKLTFTPLPWFATALGIVDVDDRAPDGTVRSRLLAEFDGRVPEDNYEGVAVTHAGGVRHLWLIADDNFMTYQRSLLLKLRWDQRDKAPELPRAPNRRRE